MLKKSIIFFLCTTIAVSLFLFLKFQDYITLKLFNQELARQNIEKNNRLYFEKFRALEGRPPIAPKWVFEPWVWEDNINTQQATWDLVQGYLQRDIPVGGVIIDSPWETGYNTFEFDPERYPDPQKLIADLKNEGVHTILWTTGIIAPNSPNYDFACENGYFIRKIDEDSPCPVTLFWKTLTASHIDFFNPEALAWWQSQMDKALDLGVDGWKVDMSDYHLGDLGASIQTHAGVKSVKGYTNAFYRMFYEYTKEKRGADRAMITARPYCSQTWPPYWYAPIDVNTAGWVGDQPHSWDGLTYALNDIFVSVAAGYAAVGSDIGGYFGEQTLDADSKALFIRWAQMGALMPIMENGGLDEHRPWIFDDETVDIYRYFAKLHHQLVPYLYSLNIAANKTGMPLVRPIEQGDHRDNTKWLNDWRYTLGGDIFIAPMVNNSLQRQIKFPPGAWLDYWDDDKLYEGGQTIDYNVPVSRYPIFLKAGAIIPMQVDDAETGHGSPASRGSLTFIVYPTEKSERIFYLAPDDSIRIESSQTADGIEINLSASLKKFIFRVKVSTEIKNVKLVSSGNFQMQESFIQFESTDHSWFYDTTKKYVWIKFSGSGNNASLKLNVSL